MGLLKGAMTVSRFRVNAALPDDFRDRISEGLMGQAFQQPQTYVGQQEVQGWVEVHNLLDTSFEDNNRWLYQPWALFALRVDKKRLPANLLGATLQKRCQDWCEEKGTGQCPASVRTRLQDALKEEWFARTLPAVSVTEVGWNLVEGYVLVGSHSAQVCERVRKRFYQSFGYKLVPSSPLDPLAGTPGLETLLASGPAGDMRLASMADGEDA
jgi:recombination associated protein RdgC